MFEKINEAKTYFQPTLAAHGYYCKHTVAPFHNYTLFWWLVKV